MLKHRGFPGRLPGTDLQFTIRRADPKGATPLKARERMPTGGRSTAPPTPRSWRRSGSISGLSPSCAATSTPGGSAGCSGARWWRRRTPSTPRATTRCCGSSRNGRGGASPRSSTMAELAPFALLPRCVMGGDPIRPATEEARMSRFIIVVGRRRPAAGGLRRKPLHARAHRRGGRRGGRAGHRRRAASRAPSPAAFSAPSDRKRSARRPRTAVFFREARAGAPRPQGGRGHSPAPTTRTRG